ncbi:MAG: HEAT repeat domain-containing protein [Tepidisphaeraceae bacterium]
MKRAPSLRIVSPLLFVVGLAGCSNQNSGAIPAPKLPPQPPAVRKMPIDPSLQAAAEQELTRAFQSNDPVLRANSVEASQKTLGIKAADRIMLALNDPDGLVRFAGAMAAGAIKLQSAYSKLLAMTQDENPNVQVAVRYALHRLGDYRLSHDFERFATDADAHVRANTVLALGLLGEPSALNILRYMRGDPDPAVRLQVAEAMYRLGDEKAREKLVAGTISSYPDDQIVSLLALAGTHDRSIIRSLHAQLTSEYEEVTLAAARACGMVGSDDGMAVALKGTSSVDPRQRGMAALALGAIGRSDAQPQLSHLLHDADPAVRLAAATALLQLKSPS